MESFETQDDLERLKAWWANYGRAVVAGIVLGLIVVAAVLGWRTYQKQTGEAASQLYNDLLTAAQKNDAAAVSDKAQKLVADYAHTPYAGKAALVLAKQAFEAKDVTKARQHWQWAMQEAKEDGVRHSARLRLARLALDEKKPDEALGLVADVSAAGAFASHYHELRGDALLAQGKRTEARAAYEEARKALLPDSLYGRVLDLKIQDTGAGV